MFGPHIAEQLSELSHREDHHDDCRYGSAVYTRPNRQPTDSPQAAPPSTALMKRGELPSVKIGRSRRVPAVALEEYVGKLVGNAADRTPPDNEPAR